jgi:hypothetical protein
MRKHYKRKRQSCSLCKLHKTGHVNRWRQKDQMLLKEADFDMRQVKQVTSRHRTRVGYLRKMKEEYGLCRFRSHGCILLP